MKQIVLEIEDSAFEKFMGMIELCPQVSVVEERDMAIGGYVKMDERLKQAIHLMEQEHLINKMYDYAWIKVAMESIDGMPFFRSAQSFVDYLIEVIQPEKLPSESSISKMMNTPRGKLFEWTFSDNPDKGEAQRRNNIVRRFFNLTRGE